MLSLLLSLLPLALCLSSELNRYRVHNNRILDSSNRECFFHGVNVVYKSDPYLPFTDHFDANLSFSNEDMLLLNELGQNVIRLGVMWPGVNPQQDQINQTYIDAAASLITEAYANYNISTLVDCHQDALAEVVCGEGIPNWAIKPTKWNFPAPLHKAYPTNSDHMPSRSDCLSIQWAEYYISETTSSAFQTLYQNTDGLTESFANYWGTLAKSFKSTPGIIGLYTSSLHTNMTYYAHCTGFELLNEPWVGDIYKHPELVIPGQADKTNLAPFYDAIVPSIYSNDSERVVFFESVVWDDEFNASWTKSGFERVPGGSEYANQSVYSFHYYRPPMGPNAGNENKYFFESVVSEGDRLNATSFLTEFDISNDDETEDQFVAMSTTMDYCDEYFVSWIGWEYKPFAGALADGTCTGCGYGVFHSNGTENVLVRKALSRTYAQMVAGRTQFQKFDWALGGNFTLIYAIDTSIKEPTTIYLNKQYWYPNGYELVVVPDDEAVFPSERGNYIDVYNSDENKYNGQSVRIQINPK